MRPLETDAPEQTFPLLRRLIPSFMQPFPRGARKRWQRRVRQLEQPYWSVFPYTQVSMAKQKNLVHLGELIESEEIPGAVVECGVLDGGCSALMGHATSGSARPMHLFDSWEGLPDSTFEDGNDSSKWSGECVGSPKRVRAVFKELNIDMTRASFHRGWFHDTFPHVEIPSIALLDIDCDFYEPTKLCLETWFDRISDGGFVQIDDYDCFQGSRKATDEFLLDFPEIQLEQFVSPSGEGQAYYFRKPLRATLQSN